MHSTSIMALNDDCLLEVFEYLDWWDLGAVADVCRQFRRNAKACFAYSKKDDFEVFCVEYQKLGMTSFNQMLVKTVRCLRNFGEFIIKIDAKPSRKHSRTTIDLLVRYAGQTLTELNLCHLDLQDDLVAPMGRLVERLHKLTLDSCKMDVKFLSMWPLWSAELRELEWTRCGVPLEYFDFDFLHQPFPKLLKIALLDVFHLRGTDIAKMLKHNPQIKELSFRPADMNFSSHGTIMAVIAQHVPEIESLNLQCVDVDVSTLPAAGVQYFSHLKNLRALTIGLNSIKHTEYIVSVISAIGAANIQLKCLVLMNLSLEYFGNCAETFVNAISRFTQLESLELHAVLDLTAYHLIEICKNCSKLSTICTSGDFVPTPANILNIIRHSEKLQSLSIVPNRWPDGAYHPFCIDINTFTELVNIVKSRRNDRQTKLTIWFSVFYNTEVPIELARVHEELLSIGWIRWIPTHTPNGPLIIPS